VTGNGKNGHRYSPGVQVGCRCHLANRKQNGSGLAASATSVRMECHWLLPLGNTGIEVLVGGPDLTDG